MVLSKKIGGDMKYDCIVVGAGICGLSAARQLATKGYSVLIFEKSHYIGGLCREDYYKGTRFSMFGAHIFHTNNPAIWNFLSQFTEWDYYTHYVKSFCNGKLWSIPIDYTELPDRAELSAEVASALYTDYSKKMWGQYYEVMLKESGKRLHSKKCPNDNRYFKDKYQGLPSNGYNRMFQKMIEMKNISVNLNYDFNIDWVDRNTPVIYTGRIDKLLGDVVLPFMTMRFEDIVDGNFPWSDKYGVINFPQDYDFIRAHSSKILYKQDTKHDVIVYDYPGGVGPECYPIVYSDSIRLWQDINIELINKYPNVIPAGRAGKFEYMDMDQAVQSGIDAANEVIKEKVKICT
jgi:UDP-galactopyranose mutase